MRNMRVVLAIIAVAILAALIGCGPSKADLAQREVARLKKVDEVKTEAFRSFQDFMLAQNGDTATRFAKEMEKQLGTVGLDLDAIGVAPGFVTQQVQKLYVQDAAAAYKRLKLTHGKIRVAQDLADKYREYISKAGKDVSPAMEQKLAIIVNLNKIEEGMAGQRAHGVKPPLDKPHLYGTRRPYRRR